MVAAAAGDSQGALSGAVHQQARARSRNAVAQRLRQHQLVVHVRRTGRTEPPGEDRGTGRRSAAPSTKEQFVFREGSSPVMHTGIAVTADIARICAEATNADEVRVHLARAVAAEALQPLMHARLEQLQDVADAALAALDPGLLDKAKRVKEAWQNGASALDTLTAFDKAAPKSTRRLTCLNRFFRSLTTPTPMATTTRTTTAAAAPALLPKRNAKASVSARSKQQTMAAPSPKAASGSRRSKTSTRTTASTQRSSRASSTCCRRGGPKPRSPKTRTCPAHGVRSHGGLHPQVREQSGQVVPT